MLRINRRPVQLLRTLHRSFASNASQYPAAYVNFKKMMEDCKKTYPGLYPSEKDCITTQKKLLDNLWEPKTLEKNVNAYNDAYMNLWNNHGLNRIDNGANRAPRLLKDFMKMLDYEFLLSAKPVIDQSFLTEDWETMDKKMKQGQEIVKHMEECMKTSAKKIHETKGWSEALMVDRAIDNAKLALKEWQLWCAHEDDSWLTMSGLPFDMNMFMQVWLDVKHEKMGNNWDKTTLEQKDAIAKDISETVWNTMYDRVVKYTQPNRTEAEFNDLKKVWFEVLSLHDFSVNRYKDIAKIMFLSAYWAGGKKKVFEVLEQIPELLRLKQETPADYLELWKQAYKENPDAKLGAEIGLFVKALDHAFVPKLLAKLRTEHCGAHYKKCSYEVIQKALSDDLKFNEWCLDLELEYLPPLEEEKASLRESLCEFGAEADRVIYRQNEVQKHREHLKSEFQKYTKMELPSMDDMLKELLYEELWVKENDARLPKIDAFHKKLVSYMKSGKGDIQALENEAKGLLPSELTSDKNPIDDAEYQRLWATFIRGHRSRMDLWDFNSVCFWQEPNGLYGKRYKKSMVSLHVRKDKFDDVLVRMVKHLIEDGTIIFLEKICEDYGAICKKYKGEVYGKITSHAELSKKEFDQIIDALTKQNPGKKFFLEQEVDPNILSGFIIQCGPTKLDYSLLRETKELKKIALLG